MSKPSALPSPDSRASSAGARPRPRRARRARSRRPARAASAAGATPPEEQHHRGLGQPALGRGLAEPAEVAAEQGGEVGVDDRRRAALVLAELRQHLVRGGDVDVGQLGAQALGDRALVRGLEVGEEQADRDRLGARARARLAAIRSSSASVERLDHAVGPDPLGRPRSRSSAPPAARASARRGGRGWGRFWRRDLEQVGEPARRDQRRPRAALARAARWCRRSSRGRRSRPSPGCGAGALERRLDRRRARPRDWSSGVVGALAVCSRLPSKTHRVGEGPADVDPEQHLGRQPLVADVAAAEGAPDAPLPGHGAGDQRRAHPAGADPQRVQLARASRR